MVRDLAKRLTFWSVLGCAVVAAAPLGACLVPVFRYALERWPAEPYEAHVFHRSPVADAATKALEKLKSAGPTDYTEGAVYLHVTDLAGKVEGMAAKVWERQTSPEPPWMVLRYPRSVPIEGDVWAGPLSEKTVSQLLDSPARQKIAKEILGGKSAVFLLLENEDKKLNDEIARFVDAKLKQMEDALQIPEPEGGSWGDPLYDQMGAPDLKVAFSFLRISRKDPAEQIFVKMLLGGGTEEETPSDPVLFPFFGRGRALCALLGKEQIEEGLEEACVFLTGPCSCTVKFDNPGLDMLMTVDWDAELEKQMSAVAEVQPPPLTGLSEFAVPDAEEGAEAPASPPDSTPTGAEDPGSTAAEELAKRVAKEPTSAVAKGARTSLVRNVALAVGGGLVILALVGFLTWRRSVPARR